MKNPPSLRMRVLKRKECLIMWLQGAATMSLSFSVGNKMLKFQHLQLANNMDYGVSVIT